ncbi:MAG TPA: A24 family peptidase [Candidatus Woesebacteria bacterium]|nr:A24 family peptidase [Candidatus Woesebacteria bacterium]
MILFLLFHLLKGKCRYCKASIAFGHVYSEIITGVLFILTWHLSNQLYGLIQFHILHLVITSILIVMLLSDIRYQIIPDEMQIALGLVAIVKFFLLTINPYTSIVTQIFTIEFLSQIAQFIGGGIIVMLPLLAIFLITKGKGMGFGDVKLTFNMGLLLGLWSGLYALYLGFISGGLAGALILLTKRGKLKSKIAFGPFLILGTYIVLFYAYEVGELLQKIYGFR